MLGCCVALDCCDQERFWFPSSAGLVVSFTSSRGGIPCLIVVLHRHPVFDCCVASRKHPVFDYCVKSAERFLFPSSVGLMICFSRSRGGILCFIVALRRWFPSSAGLIVSFARSRGGIPCLIVALRWHPVFDCCVASRKV